MKFNRWQQYPNLRSVYGIPQSAIVLVTVARLVRWKNIGMVVRALSALGRTDVYLFVVGDGPEKNRLVELASQCGVAALIRFVGQVFNTAPFYAASDIFVLPSLIESFGVVYAEAMFMGLPCIGMKNNPPYVLSSALDVIPEGRAGYCISDQAELVERLRVLVEDANLRRKLGEYGYQLATLQYSTKHYVDFFLELINRESGLSPTLTQLASTKSSTVLSLKRDRPVI